MSPSGRVEIVKWKVALAVVAVIIVCVFFSMVSSAQPEAKVIVRVPEE